MSGLSDALREQRRKDEERRSNIIEAVESFLDARTHYFNQSFDVESGVFRFNRVGGRGDLHRHAIFVLNDGFCAATFFAERVDIRDRAKLQAVAELVCRINTHLMSASLIFNANTGVIYARVYVPCGDVVPNDEMILEAIGHSRGLMIEHRGDVADVLNNVLTPLEAEVQFWADTMLWMDGWNNL